LIPHRGPSQATTWSLATACEASARAKKIQAALIDQKGKLRCEVPRCGLKYGELGKEFAHVHHIKPLSDAPAEGHKVLLKDLAIVCANCHAMIHRGGQPKRTINS
jgi:predicted HNH restriction endonuclease